MRKRPAKQKTMSESSSAAQWQAAASVVNTAANVTAQSNINRKTREWNEKMYGRQRADALADWQMQNEYNSPAAQMKRYRDAGLNPNLIYGQSNEGAMVRTTDVKPWNPKAPEFRADQAIGQYFDIQQREAQINNLKAQNDNILAQKNLIDANTAKVYKDMENIGSVMDSRQWKLDADKSLFPGSLEMQDWKIRHLAKKMDIDTQSHEYNLLKAAQSLEKGAVDIINSRIDTHLKRLDQAIKAGIISQQTYDRERTKTDIMRAQATEQLLNESRRGMEQKRLEYGTNDWLNEVNAVTNILRLFK